MNMNDIMERLKKFVLAHPEMSKNGFIQGLDQETGKIVIIVNGQERRITIDELENGRINEPEVLNAQMQTAQPISNQEASPVLEDIEVMEEPSTPMDEKVETLTPEPASQPMDKPLRTLKDLKEAIDTKNEEAVKKAYTFAIDERTGVISDNKAINLVTNNSMNNVINSVLNSIQYVDDLNMYDITGKFIGPMQKENQPQDITDLIDKSFKNVLIPVQVANVFHNGQFTDANIMAAKKTYTERIKSKVTASIQDKKNLEALKDQDITPDNLKKQPAQLKLKPDTRTVGNAAFADILILTLIVLIYAAIIINLISKLK